MPVCDRLIADGKGILSSPMTTVNSLRLNGLNRGKLALYVWFCARGTRMQQTALPGSDTAGGTGDR